MLRVPTSDPVQPPVDLPGALPGPVGHCRGTRRLAAEPPRGIAVADRRRLRRHADPGHQHALHPGRRAADGPAHPLLSRRPVASTTTRFRRTGTSEIVVPAGGGSPARPPASSSVPSPPSSPCGSASAPSGKWSSREIFPEPAYEMRMLRYRITHRPMDGSAYIDALPCDASRRYAAFSPTFD